MPQGQRPSATIPFKKDDHGLSRHRLSRDARDLDDLLSIRPSETPHAGCSTRTEYAAGAVIAPRSIFMTCSSRVRRATAARIFRYSLLP